MPDADAVYAQALTHGRTSVETPRTRPYGDRSEEELQTSALAFYKLVYRDVPGTLAR